MHVVARIGKAHGLRGEVTVQVHTDVPEERLVPGAELTTEPAERGPLVLRTVRVHQGAYLLGFEGVADRTAAESLRGTRLLTGEEVVEEDGWYEEELLGLAVELVDGTPVGRVSGLQVRPAQDLLEITRPDGTLGLVPFVDELVPDVDQKQGRVVIDPPPGLLELGE